MRILAFETSAKAGSVALFENDKLLCEQYANTGLTHSQTVMVMAQQAMENCGLAPKDIDAVSVAAGPGSFTGVRIGVSAAKGFAWGREIPCYGVSTLDAMARQLGVYNGFVLPVMDARRQQVYTALFSVKDGALERLWEDKAISLEELKKELKILEKDIFLVGDGASLCYNTLKDEVPNLVFPPEHRMHQRASGVALAALALIEKGEQGDANTLTPNYLRLSQAERERLERENNLTK